jgi:hypothetical protein
MIGCFFFSIESFHEGWQHTQNCYSAKSAVFRQNTQRKTLPQQHRTKCPQLGKEWGKTIRHSVNMRMRQRGRWDNMKWQFFWAVSKSLVRSQQGNLLFYTNSSFLTSEKSSCSHSYPKSRTKSHGNFPKFNLHLNSMYRIGRYALRETADGRDLCFYRSDYQFCDT